MVFKMIDAHIDSLNLLCMERVIFTRGPFGLRVLSLPASVCVCLSVCHLLLVRMITRHPFKLGSPNLNQKMQNILLKVPIVLGAD